MNDEMIGRMYDDCLLAAIEYALEQAKTTPLEPGTSVGHTNLPKYGRNIGKLISINGAETLVRLEADENEVVTWDTDGIVDTNLVQEYAEQEFNILREMYMAFQETQIGGADLPTPDCDCDHCKTFSPEKHEEARQMQAQLTAEEALTEQTEPIEDITVKVSHDGEVPMVDLRLLVEERRQKLAALTQREVASQADTNVATGALQSEDIIN